MHVAILTMVDRGLFPPQLWLSEVVRRARLQHQTINYVELNAESAYVYTAAGPLR